MDLPAESFMARAIALARRGFPAPNPRVGCVIERDGVIVGEGWHRYRGTDHAEVMALKRARDLAQGARVFVTLEPCNHQGLTGPCSEALIQAGVSKVVFACWDPNPVAQGGAARLREAGIQVDQGLLEQEAARGNELFLRSIALGRAVLVLKAATSEDGSLGLPDRQIWLTGPKARRSAHRLRAECGAVLVGRGTIEVDDPLLTARIPGVRNQPIRLVMDPGGSLGPYFRVFQNGGQTWRITAPGKGGQIELPIDGEDLDLEALLVELYRRGVRAVLVEGGAETLRRFWAAGLTDYVEIFVAPTVLGGGMVWEDGLALREGRWPDFEKVGERKLDGDVHLSFRRRSAPDWCILRSRP